MKIIIPKGYRRLRVGEVIKKGDKYFNTTNKKWAAVSIFMGDRQSKKGADRIRPTSRTFTIINDYDGNDTFTVEAANANAAAYAALSELGWWVAKD